MNCTEHINQLNMSITIVQYLQIIFLIMYISIN